MLDFFSEELLLDIERDIIKIEDKNFDKSIIKDEIEIILKVSKVYYLYFLLSHLNAIFDIVGF